MQQETHQCVRHENNADNPDREIGAYPVHNQVGLHPIPDQDCSRQPDQLREELNRLRPRNSEEDDMTVQQYPVTQSAFV